MKMAKISVMKITSLNENGGQHRENVGSEMAGSSAGGRNGG